MALNSEEIERLTDTDGRVGTPGYMSPEQQDGEKPDPQDDLYVLGVCLYEALSGNAVRAGAYEDLAAIDEAIPPALDELIQNCIAPKAVRIKSAAEFVQQLSTAFQPFEPLSKVLASGQLYQVIQAIRNMNPTDFMMLPAGQRRVVLTRARDVIASDDRRLNTARSDFLTVLSTLAIQTKSADYAAIIRPALEYGFDRRVDSWLGDRQIRNALCRAATSVTQPNHQAMVATVLEWLDATGGLSDQSERENWYYHALRELVTHLMVNQHCSDEDAEKLDEVLRKVYGFHRH